MPLSLLKNINKTMMIVLKMTENESLPEIVKSSKEVQLESLIKMITSK